MITRKEIEIIVGRKVKDNALKHISDMFEEIQMFLLFGDPNCKFVELCANENWEYATGIADPMNKELLTKTTMYQDFVKSVKTSPEYISKIRGEKLNTIFDNE